MLSDEAIFNHLRNIFFFTHSLSILALVIRKFKLRVHTLLSNFAQSVGGVCRRSANVNVLRLRCCRPSLDPRTTQNSVKSPIFNYHLVGWIQVVIKSKIQVVVLTKRSIANVVMLDLIANS